MSGSKALRGLGVTRRWGGGFVRMSGYMDEFADYSALLAEATPLRLKLDGIVALNSLGLRKWIGFIRDFGVRQLELHECPTTFVDAANMMPGHRLDQRQYAAHQIGARPLSLLWLP